VTVAITRHIAIPASFSPRLCLIIFTNTEFAERALLRSKLTGLVIFYKERPSTKERHYKG
ncbi:MAG: hypothetical protein ACRCYN_04585, partial [Plesiomonas sp.]